jgi:phosphoglucosamine mutase
MLRFGTDGVRGRANQELTMEVGYWLGVAVAELVASDGGTSLLVGRDTRASGFWLSSAVGLGAATVGLEVVDCGVFPTGGISFAARTARTPAVVISASHNPYFDNGIKVLDRSGGKLDPSLEQRIEERLDALIERRASPRRGELGAYRTREWTEEYLGYLVGALGGDAPVARVAVDAANGAAFRAAPALLARLGLEVAISIGVEPTGTNINEGVGALHPERLRAAMAAGGAELGLAFDGDADRLIAVTGGGRVIDGDDLLVLIGLGLAREGLLARQRIAATVMSNLGLEASLERHGIGVRRTSVGDRAVALAMAEEGLVLGGEQSGHVIASDWSPTGDGLLTAVLLLRALRVLGEDPDSALARYVVRFPQVHRQVATPHRERILVDEGFASLVHTLEAELGERGRLVLRPSGTEPVFRIMVEAVEEDHASAIADRLVRAAQEVSSRLR